MNRRSVLALTSLALVLAIGCTSDELVSEEENHAAGPEQMRAAEPSSGARDMAGAVGTIEFKPTDWAEGTTSWWSDSDGLAPGVAGCHIGTDETGVPNGRRFGEACLPSGLLVESNPGVDEVHRHAGDLGHPDTFNCNDWCKGQGASGGVCTQAAAPPCSQSAVCSCEPLPAP